MAVQGLMHILGCRPFPGFGSETPMQNIDHYFGLFDVVIDSSKQFGSLCGMNFGRRQVFSVVIKAVRMPLAE